MVPAPKTVPLESSLVSWKLQGAVWRVHKEQADISKTEEKKSRPMVIKVVVVKSQKYGYYIRHRWAEAEPYLCHWVVHVFYDPGVRNKEQHMTLPREDLRPWINWG